MHSIVATLALTLALLPVGGQQAAWKTFTSKEGRFSVSIPGAPTLHRQEVETAVGRITMHLFVLEEGSGGYMMMYGDYPAAVIKAGNAEKIVEGASNGAAGKVQGKVTAQRKISISGFPGKEMKITRPDGSVLFSRVYLVNQRLYMISSMAANESAASQNVTKFFSSFTLAR